MFPTARVSQSREIFQQVSHSAPIILPVRPQDSHMERKSQTRLHTYV